MRDVFLFCFINLIAAAKIGFLKMKIHYHETVEKLKQFSLKSNY